MTGQRILIAGCNGLLGHRLSLMAAGRWAVFGLGRRAASPVADVLQEYIRLDITRRQEVADVVRAVSPRWVINAAAMADVDACQRDPEQAKAINVGGVDNVLDGCRACGARMVHLSTNYVFDGRRSPYGEDDDLCPVNTYGQTKAEAERLLLAGGSGHCIVRTVLLYGAAPAGRASFVQWVCSSLAGGRVVRAATDLCANPTFVDDLAAGILRMMDEGAEGVFHMAGSEGLSRHAFALKIAAAFGLETSGIEAVSCQQLNLEAPRPLRAELRTDKVRRRFNLSFCSVDEGLRAMAAECKPDR